MYTQAHCDVLVKSVEAVFARRGRIKGLKMVYEPTYPRFFQAKFEPLNKTRFSSQATGVSKKLAAAGDVADQLFPPGSSPRPKTNVVRPELNTAKSGQAVCYAPAEPAP